MVREEPTSRPFAELPEALVEEILLQTEGVGATLLAAFQQLQDQKAGFRQELSNASILSRDSDLGSPPIPTSCGVDGSFAIERLLATDLVAVAAVAIEGLAPPSEHRYWEQPRHLVHIGPEYHDADTGTIARALMIGMELELASRAPHDVVLLDGSLTTPLIYFNQAMNKIEELEAPALHTKLMSKIGKFLEAYDMVLSSRRSDRSWVGVPKYTTRREFGNRLGWSHQHDDRAILTAILEPSEYTAPQVMQRPAQPWHLNLNPITEQERSTVEHVSNQVIGLLNEIRVVYYKPQSWLPAIRLEVSRAVAENRHRLAAVLMTIKHQCTSPAILEPYPLYMADRMVKHLSLTIPTFRQVASRHVAETYQGDVSDVFLGLHGYRSESGV